MPAAGAPALRLHPFPALRYDLQHPGVGSLDAVTAPTVDQLDDPGWDALAAKSPYNVIRLIRPRGQHRHAEAGRLLTAWRAAGVLRSDGPAGLYVYEQAEADGRLQRGLVGELELVAPDAGIVLPHEDTMAGPVAERLALSKATGADLEMIFLLYAGGGAASRVTAGVEDVAGAPVLDGRLSDGSRHRVWEVTDPQLLADIAADLAPRRALIADGHHRYATYLQRQREHRTAGAGAGPWDRGLAFLVDAGAGMRLGAIHRVLAGLSWRSAVERASARATVTALGTASADWEAAVTAASADGHGPVFALASGEGAVLVRPRTPAEVSRAVLGRGGERSAAWRSLDVTAAHHWLLPEILGIDGAADRIGYEHDLEVALAAAGPDGTVVVLAPATPAQVLAVAGAGDQMPRKSTLFAPKPRVGVLMRLLDPGPVSPPAPPTARPHR